MFLEELFLNDIKLCSDCLQQLNELLLLNEKLTTLSLGNCSLGDKELEFLNNLPKK